MANTQTLAAQLLEQFPDFPIETKTEFGELTVEIPSQYLIPFCTGLRDGASFKFEQLMDLCGVDYLYYGCSEWVTERATTTGFSRGVERAAENHSAHWTKPRFAIVYHLLSMTHNHRLRVRTFPQGEPLAVSSVIKIWATANWFEREAFDLFGIMFDGHPDLRRILTDYGFIGHPFRKDFPLIGIVEPRYDAQEGRVIYEPVSIEPRTLVPKVIRDDNRYEPRFAAPPPEAKS
jgi:NADH-quinone oxidoreductase subunit C